MSVIVDGDVIRLAGVCPVEDAEPLLRALQEAHAPRLDLSGVTRMHMAVAQLVAAARPVLVGLPPEGFVRDLLLPALALDDNERDMGVAKARL